MGYKHPEECCCFPEPIKFCYPEKIRCVCCEPQLVWICKEEEFCLKECPKPKCECPKCRKEHEECPKCRKEHEECPKCHKEHEECPKCHKEHKKRCHDGDWSQDDGDGWCEDEFGWRIGGCR